MKTVCEICGASADHWRRCEDHYRCDRCGSREDMVFYVEGVFCATCWSEFVTELIARFDGETDYQSVPVCPYCGQREPDWWDRTWVGEDNEFECGRCRRSYHVEMFVIREFTTRRSETDKS